MDASPPTAYARRGISYDAYGRRYLTTFVSTDRADNDALGWFRGHVADGHVWGGYVLTHVYEPSWRVGAPLALPIAPHSDAVAA